MGYKKITVDPILGGGRACCAPPPPGSATVNTSGCDTEQTHRDSHVSQFKVLQVACTQGVGHARQVACFWVFCPEAASPMVAERADVRGHLGWPQESTSKCEESGKRYARIY